MGVDRDGSTAYCWSSSHDDVDWLCLIISSTVAVCEWCISILAVVVNDWGISILIVLTRSCSLMSPPIINNHSEGILLKCHLHWPDGK